MTARNGTGTIVVPLQALLEAMSDGVLITDEHGKCTYTNPALGQIVGMPAFGETVPETPPAWIPQDCQRAYQRYISRAIGGRFGRETIVTDWSLISAGGNQISAQLKLIPMRNGNGNSTALMWIFSPTPVEPRLNGDGRRQALEESMRRIASELSSLGVIVSTANEPIPGMATTPELERLSRRERDVVDELLRGHRVVSIAARLEVSEHTVRNHLKSIFRKLEVHSQAELVRLIRSNPKPA
jgi:PAS domain S-box-containing protein